MSGPRILAVDQGTTNTKAFLVDGGGAIVAKASVPRASSYPHPGWAEQSADEIWQSVQTAIKAVIDDSGSEGIEGVAITNQRESLVVWNAETGEPTAPCILWQCRRTADAAQALRDAGHDDWVTDRTGLSINPLFPASKLGWVMQNVPEAGELAATGTLRAGTIDCWLLWNLTAGAEFATDHSNASRTQLFDTGAHCWDAKLCDLFGAPIGALPEVRSSNARMGVTRGVADLPDGLPILAMMGDSHAALYGHGVREPGLVKATYGTGSSLMALVPERTRSTHGLSGTIAWSRGAQVSYAIEGNITVSAQAAAFAAEMLGIEDAAALSRLAQTVDETNGVAFVPALSGLGAPHWDDRARGAISGLTLASTRAHVARATFEAIAMQIADVFHAMEADVGGRMEALLADGGASENAFLMQLQADLLDRRVIRRDVAEIGALGVAAMALESIGVDCSQVLADSAHEEFAPAIASTDREKIIQTWHLAVERSKN
ncbi:FGGY family carbohydrate kinase [Tropicimonas sp. TH_r6]|uniref:FGGY family carbohydrate kinase n=1 Tax=Tropicimonas sp. TH_r6 TaxID=3082085 RepID=UPI0029546D11|nr:FGGY family carbohydrate kinase [Tropicimonas sp. TH_r6]MDV7144855.1 FGGY family carbohydrate kinase [Tropicimonas sp. TH_r6]